MHSIETVSIKPKPMTSQQAVDFLNKLDDTGKQAFLESIATADISLFKRLRKLLLEVRDEGLLSYDCSLEDENTSLIIALDEIIGDN